MEIESSQMKYFKDLQSIKNQMNELVCVYDDLQDRLYEIDRSWQNNLVFHGIKPDAGGVYESTDCLEAKIKGVLRTNLNIGREIPIGMVKYQKQAARFWSLLVSFCSKLCCPNSVCATADSHFEPKQTKTWQPSG